MAQDFSAALRHALHQSPRGHSVELYDHEDVFVRGLVSLVEEALVEGGAAIVVATPGHRARLTAELRDRGIGLEALTQAGRYIELDAAETLQQIMQFGLPDRQRFMEIAGGMLMRAANAIPEPGGRLVAFAEMVAYLCAEGNTAGAIELEGLWNELAESYAFYLHCAYPKTLFSGAGDATPLADVCGAHSIVLDASIGD